MSRAPTRNTSLPTPFDGQRVAIFEARMAGALADLVARQGGVPVAAPALREIPLADNADARSFVDSLLASQFDILIFETGVGVRMLAQSQAEWDDGLDRRAANDSTQDFRNRASLVAVTHTPLRHRGGMARIH